MNRAKWGTWGGLLGTLALLLAWRVEAQQARPRPRRRHVQRPLPPSPIVLQDQWTDVGPGVRYLKRRGQHADRRPVVIHAVYAELCNPGISVRATAPTERGKTLLRWTQGIGAVAAVNGDYFNRSSFLPRGPARGHGLDWPAQRGAQYHAVLAANQDGHVAIFPEAPSEASWTDWLATQEHFLHGGAIVIRDDVGHSSMRNPRTGVGLAKHGTELVLVVVDGRSRQSNGVTTQELAVVMKDLGCEEGVKMDGGGSTELVLGGATANVPSDHQERRLANGLAIVLEPTVAGQGAKRGWCEAGLRPSESNGGPQLGNDAGGSDAAVDGL